MESTSGDLKSIFHKYCGAKPEMESKPYSKLYKDAKLTGKKLTTNDVDINFSKVKSGKVKTINYDQFLQTLDLAATKLGKTRADLEAEIIKNCSGGPKLTGTKADYVKFHDDKSTYTGVYAKGGPTTVDAGRGGMVSDISQTCNRGAADVRGVCKK